MLPPQDALRHASTEARLRELLQERILVLDGGMGTMLQAAELTADDFGGPELEGCNEHLVLTRPDVIQGIHEAYFDAGADIVETDTFGATAIVLAEYDLQDKVREINLAASRVACAARDAVVARQPERAGSLFVAGSIGPTTKALTVTGGTSFDELLQNYRDQAAALIEGGCDLLMVETAQDTLNMKAAALGIHDAFEAAGQPLPIILSATIEPTGTMLAGQDIESWYTSIAHFRPLAVGMNCATGPEFMTDHIRSLAGVAECAVSVYPNAGLPDVDGTYPETPEILAGHLRPFVENGWINLVGGCCGTTPEHVRALKQLVDGQPPRIPTHAKRAVVSGIENRPIDPDTRPVLVGERTNVIGSLRFKRLVEAGDWEKAAEIGRAQVKRGAQVVDICLTHPDRDEVPDIDAFYPRLNRLVKAPIMVDATDPVAIEAALRHCQGKAIINSINLEDGEERFEQVVPLARRYGAALVVGTIDEDPEQGMAVTAARKLEVAKRSFDLLTKKYGVEPSDIIFDPLVFPCGTGDENYVGSAKETVEGVQLITKEFPECTTILGISNVSFGLPESAREVVNSVFLYDCVQAGLTYAIVNTQGIERYPEIPEKERQLCRALLYNTGDDPLGRLVEHFRGIKAKKHRTEKPSGSTHERLAKYVVEGTKEWLIEDLDELLRAGDDPLMIINGPLMEGMAEVGQLFGDNQLIVAEVLQSAEVMKAAVSHLEPHMDAETTAMKGKVLLATVKGDVHDIGKNLVEIIFSNNGYAVTDLGIKVPPERLIEACREHRPDIIGLSGLLVKSAQQMVITAQDLRRAGITAPIVVGGAALSKKFTATRIAPEYPGIVAYARDAMGGLDIVDRIQTDAAAFDEVNRAQQAEVATTRPSAKPADATHVPLKQVVPPETGYDRQLWEEDPRELFPWINPKMLYGKHMGLRGDPQKLLAQRDSKALALQDLWKELLMHAPKHHLLHPRGVWQYFPAQADGDDVVVYDPNDPSQELERFHFNRQATNPRRCLSDYLRTVDSGVMDVIGLFCVTAGDGVRDQARRWLDDGEYLKAHALQALALETAEAFAERLHARMRAHFGVVEDLSKKEIWQARYEGRRYSFGYPACPELEDQRKLWRLLRPEDIGVQLTEGDMMDPEASVSAIVFHHPEAEYFQL